MALALYKTELSQAREVQLGTILTIVGDSEKMALFTLPWRKTATAKASEPADPVPLPVTPPVTPPATP